MDEDAFYHDLLHAVEQQLASPQTRYVTRTFERLTARGMSPDDAKARIAACLGEETDAMWRSKRGFDEAGYRKRLDDIDSTARFDPEDGDDPPSTD